MPPAVYSAKPARVGNSHGYRLDAAFFREHPDMAEACDVTPVGDGAFLLVRHARQRVARRASIRWRPRTSRGSTPPCSGSRRSSSH